MAALIDGQSVREIERDTGVPKSTISDWGKETQEIVPGVRNVSDIKKEKIKGLLIDLVIAKIESQLAINRHIHDKEWLMKQDASALAMLLGVSDDKLIRLLEKFGSA